MTALPNDKSEIECDFLLLVDTLKKLVEKLFRKFTPNPRRLKNVVLIIYVMVKYG